MTTQELSLKEKQFDARTLAALGITLLFWASAFAGIRAALDAYGPGHLALFRFLVASATLAIYALVTRMPLPDREDLPRIAALGFVGITVYHVALNYGEETVTAGAASMLIAAAPAVTALLATRFLGERLEVWGWAGIGVSFAGVALIALGEGSGVAFDPGALLVLLSACATSVYFVFQKPLLKKYGAFRFTAYGIWAGTLFMLALLPGLPQAIAEAPPGATLAVVYLGVFPAALAYMTWTYVLSRAPASIATSFLYLSPVLATFIAWVWLGETPALLSIVGGAAALAGVIVVNRWGR
ncbi:MAG: DMT family transporter [Anaerolineae bacterium]|nr:DMT family transporter [Anaerolineae bacterium]